MFQRQPANSSDETPPIMSARQCEPMDMFGVSRRSSPSASSTSTMVGPGRPESFQLAADQLGSSVIKIIDIQKRPKRPRGSCDHDDDKDEASLERRPQAAAATSSSRSSLPPHQQHQHQPPEVAPSNRWSPAASGSQQQQQQPQLSRQHQNQKQPSGETLSSFESDYDLLVYLGETETEDIVETERSLDYQDQAWRQSICGGASLAPTIDGSLSELVLGSSPLQAPSLRDFDLLNTPTPAPSSSGNHPLGATNLNRQQRQQQHRPTPVDSLQVKSLPRPQQRQNQATTATTTAPSDLECDKEVQLAFSSLTLGRTNLAAPSAGQDRWRSLEKSQEARDQNNNNNLKSRTMDSRPRQPSGQLSFEAAELDRLLAEMSQSLDLESLARYDRRPPAVATHKEPQQQHQQKQQLQRPQQRQLPSRSNESILDEYDGASRMLEQMIAGQLELDGGQPHLNDRRQATKTVPKPKTPPPPPQIKQAIATRRLPLGEQSSQSSMSRDSPKSVISVVRAPSRPQAPYEATPTMSADKAGWRQHQRRASLVSRGSHETHHHQLAPTMPPPPPPVDYEPREPLGDGIIRLVALEPTADEEEEEEEAELKESNMDRMRRRTLSSMRSVRHKLADFMEVARRPARSRAASMGPPSDAAAAAAAPEVEEPPEVTKEPTSRGRESRSRRRGGGGDNEKTSLGHELRERLSRSKSRVSKWLQRANGRWQRARSQPPAKSGREEAQSKKEEDDGRLLQFQPGDIARNSSPPPPRPPEAQHETAKSSPDSFNRSLDRHLERDVQRRAQEKAGAPSSGGSSQLDGLDLTGPPARRTPQLTRSRSMRQDQDEKSSHSLMSLRIRRLSASLRPNHKTMPANNDDDLDTMQVRVSSELPHQQHPQTTTPKAPARRARRRRRKRNRRHSASPASSGSSGESGQPAGGLLTADQYLRSTTSSPALRSKSAAASSGCLLSPQQPQSQLQPSSPKVSTFRPKSACAQLSAPPQEVASGQQEPPPLLDAHQTKPVAPTSFPTLAAVAAGAPPESPSSQFGRHRDHQQPQQRAVLAEVRQMWSGLFASPAARRTATPTRPPRQRATGRSKSAGPAKEASATPTERNPKGAQKLENLKRQLKRSAVDFFQAAQPSPPPPPVEGRSRPRAAWRPSTPAKEDLVEWRPVIKGSHLKRRRSFHQMLAAASATLVRVGGGGAKVSSPRLVASRLAVSPYRLELELACGSAHQPAWKQDPLQRAFPQLFPLAGSPARLPSSCREPLSSLSSSPSPSNGCGGKDSVQLTQLYRGATTITTTTIAKPEPSLQPPPPPPVNKGGCAEQDTDSTWDVSSSSSSSLEREDNFGPAKMELIGSTVADESALEPREQAGAIEGFAIEGQQVAGSHSDGSSATAQKQPKTTTTQQVPQQQQQQQQRQDERAVDVSDLHAPTLAGRIHQFHASLPAPTSAANKSSSHDDAKMRAPTSATSDQEEATQKRLSVYENVEERAATCRLPEWPPRPKQQQPPPPPKPKQQAISAAPGKKEPESPGAWSVGDPPPLPPPKPPRPTKLAEAAARQTKESNGEEDTAVVARQPQRRLVSMLSITQDPNDQLMVTHSTSSPEPPPATPPSAHNSRESLTQAQQTKDANNNNNNSDEDSGGSSLAAVAQNRQRLLATAAAAASTPSTPIKKSGAFVEGRGAASSRVKRLAKTFELGQQQQQVPTRANIQQQQEEDEVSSSWYDAEQQPGGELDELEVARFLEELEGAEPTAAGNAASSVSTGAEPFVTVADSTLNDDNASHDQHQEASDDTLNDGELDNMEADMEWAQEEEEEQPTTGKDADRELIINQPAAATSAAQRVESDDSDDTRRPPPPGGEHGAAVGELANKGAVVAAAVASSEQKIKTTNSPQTNNHHDNRHQETKTQPPESSQHQKKQPPTQPKLTTEIAQLDEQQLLREQPTRTLQPEGPSSSAQFRADLSEIIERRRLSGQLMVATTAATLKGATSHDEKRLAQSKELRGLTRYYRAILRRRRQRKRQASGDHQDVNNQSEAVMEDYIHSSESSSDDDDDEEEEDDDSQSEEEDNKEEDERRLMKEAKKCSRLYEELERMLAARADEASARRRQRLLLSKQVCVDELEDDSEEEGLYDESVISGSDQVSLSSSSLSCESLPELKQRQNLQKLYNIVKEIQSSERKFVDTLKLLNEDFRGHMEPLLAQAAPLGHRREADTIRALLRHLPQLQALNESLLAELERAGGEWPKTKRIAHVLVKLGPFLKHYSTYIREFDSLQSQLNEALRRWPLLEERVRSFEASDRCQKLSVQHHLLRPVQRIPQYRLLLQQYLQHLKPDDPDYEETVEALEVVSRVAEHANQSMSEGANFAKLLALQAKVVAKQRDIVQPGRVFVKEGELMKVCRKQQQPRYFVLLNDALLYLTRVQSSDLLYLNNELALDDCRISVASEQNPALVGQQFESEFSVCAKLRSFRLVARSREERDQWVSALRRTIDEHQARRRSFSIRSSQLERLTSEVQAHQEDQQQEETTTQGALLGQQAPLWTPDSRVTMCQLCTSTFSALFRRHHCRACGRVVCSACSANRAPLMYLKCRAARVCDHCFHQLRQNIHLYYLRSPSLETEQQKKKKTTTTPSNLQITENQEDELRRLDEHFRTLVRSQFVRRPEWSSQALRLTTRSTKQPPTLKLKEKQQDEEEDSTAARQLRQLGANDQGSLISGYLHRRHPTKAKWKRQWFVIRDKVLYAYRAIDDVAPASSLPLIGFRAQQPEEPLDQLDPRSLIQLQHTPGHQRPQPHAASHKRPPTPISHLFKAESVGAAERWLEAFAKSTVLD